MIDVVCCTATALLLLLFSETGEVKWRFPQGSATLHRNCKGYM